MPWLNTQNCELAEEFFHLLYSVRRLAVYTTASPHIDGFDTLGVIPDSPAVLPASHNSHHSLGSNLCVQNLFNVRMQLSSLIATFKTYERLSSENLCSLLKRNEITNSDFMCSFEQQLHQVYKYVLVLCFVRASKL